MLAISREQASKVLATIDAGLCKGKGVPVPGQTCVEAAVCYGLGLPHGDNPDCVSPALQQLKIILNDSCWSSTEARAKGMRRIGLAQLGSAGVLNEGEFSKRLAEWTIRSLLPKVFRMVAEQIPCQVNALIAVALRCEQEGTAAAARAAADDAVYAAAYAARDAVYAANDAVYAAVYAARAAADAAVYAANDAVYAAVYAARAAADAAVYAARAAADAADDILSFVAEGAVQILVSMQAPGCVFLDLAPLEG